LFSTITRSRLRSHGSSRHQPQPKRLLVPFKQLAGVGIVFNFLIAAARGLRNIGFWSQPAIPEPQGLSRPRCPGDDRRLSPLVDENRIFARIGLELINEDRGWA